jgi:hypothetical protein
LHRPLRTLGHDDERVSGQDGGIPRNEEEGWRAGLPLDKAPGNSTEKCGRAEWLN